MKFKIFVCLCTLLKVTNYNITIDSHINLHRMDHKFQCEIKVRKTNKHRHQNRMLNKVKIKTHECFFEFFVVVRKKQKKKKKIPVCLGRCFRVKLEQKPK